LEIKQNHWRILKKKLVFRTNVEQMLKRTTPTDLDTQPTTTQQG
jgi:hypothetical protein